MSSPTPHQNQPQPIPLPTQAIQQQPMSIPPSMAHFPSTSEFNQPLQQNYSMASINYNQEQNPQLANEQLDNNVNALNEASIKEIERQEEEQVEELQKVSLGKNQIDQDQIMKMFREQEEKKNRNKQDYLPADKKKTIQSGANNLPRGDKRNTNKQPSSRKQQTHQQLHRKRQTPQDSLTLLHKTTSFKDTSKLSHTASTYTTISSSQSIRDLLLQYKIQYRSSIYDQQWQKQRYKLRQQFFEQLCIGVQEMRQREEIQLTEAQQEVLQKIRETNEQMNKLSYDFGTFRYCRNLVMEVDIQLFVHFHQRSKQPLSKDYKGQYKFLLANLKDPENYQLRKKLLTHQFTADMIKVANEIEFFTQAKRTEIKDKEKKLLKEFSVDRETIMLKPEFQHEKQEQRMAENIKYDSVDMAQRKGSQLAPDTQVINPRSSQSLIDEPFSISSLLTVNKYLDESSLTQLEELLSDEQLKKMRGRLEDDLRGEPRLKLMKKFDEQFTFDRE